MTIGATMRAIRPDSWLMMALKTQNPAYALPVAARERVSMRGLPAALAKGRGNVSRRPSCRAAGAAAKPVTLFPLNAHPVFGGLFYVLDLPFSILKTPAYDNPVADTL